jgi:hypothetical protein
MHNILLNSTMFQPTDAWRLGEAREQWRPRKDVSGQLDNISIIIDVDNK